MLWKLELHDVGDFRLLLWSYPCRKALFCFVWLYTLILVELRAFHCCLWLVACITPISFSWNDDPRSLEFDPRKWQRDDGTGDDHRISDHRMGINSREASGFCTHPPPGPTFGTVPTAPSSGVRKMEEPILAGLPTGQVHHWSFYLPCRWDIVILMLCIRKQKLTEIKWLVQDRLVWLQTDFCFQNV